MSGVARRERDMGYTREEFIRLLPKLNGECYRVDGEHIEIDWGKGCVLITLGPDGFRQIAMMRLPRMQVIFQYQNLSDEEREAFEHRFERSYQKGGG